MSDAYIHVLEDIRTILTSMSGSLAKMAPPPTPASMTAVPNPLSQPADGHDIQGLAREFFDIQTRISVEREFIDKLSTPMWADVPREHQELLEDTLITLINRGVISFPN